ncbi:uncharacterized protein [Littorina saxatilis]|uniref:uncharacterized protein n=1 Tax=Littorina saxatilis TaxID=31220 RepID=UPI0038B53836
MSEAEDTASVPVVGGRSIRQWCEERKTAVLFHTCSTTRYEVVTMDGRAAFVMDGTDDVITEWVVSLNWAIMATRCRGHTVSVRCGQVGVRLQKVQGVSRLVSDYSECKVWAVSARCGQVDVGLQLVSDYIECKVWEGSCQTTVSARCGQVGVRLQLVSDYIECKVWEGSCQTTLVQGVGRLVSDYIECKVWEGSCQTTVGVRLQLVSDYIECKVWEGSCQTTVGVRLQLVSDYIECKVWEGSCQTTLVQGVGRLVSDYSKCKVWAEHRNLLVCFCSGNSDSHDDVIGVDRDNSDNGALEQGLKTLSLAEAENEFLHAWFPDLDAQSYIIPRVHYGTVHVLDDYDVGGHKVKVLKTDEAIKNQMNKQNREVGVVMSIDDILKRVHYTMNTIKEKIAPSEVMVIMTEAKHGLYSSLYAGAADRNNNNTERGGPSKVTKWDMKRDLADLLVVHRDHGLLLGAVINNTGSGGVTTLCEDMGNAVAYLDKAEAVVNDVILPGMAGGPAVAVNKTILLPNLERANLQTTIVSLQPKVRERLERCVGVQPGHDVTRLCLTKDDMADEQRLKEWWTACPKHDTQGDTARVGDEVYRALVARFAVPLTTVEMSLSTQPRLQLWTAGHVVHAVEEEHGRDLTRIALFPRQVELLEDTPDDDDDGDVRILHGGPGTAKTILLLLRSVSWSRDGCDRVFNIQTERDGQAAAYLVSHQLRETVARARQGDTAARPDFTVQHVNMAPWWDEDNEYGDSEDEDNEDEYGDSEDEDNKDWTEEGRLAVAAWCDARSEDRKVHIIADEANGHIISHLYRELKGRGCTVKLWAAGVNLGIPDDMTRYVRQITAPLRCPPCVVREVEQAYDMKEGRVPPYTKPPVAPPCDGPPVITIKHYEEDYRGDREGHQAEGDRDRPWRCEECGRRVAHTLLHSLHLGRHDNGPGEQGGLRYNDVFIMGSLIDCAPDTPDDDKHSPAPFIRGLRQLGIPTRVVDNWDSEAVRRVAENSWTPLAVADAVTIVNQRTVWGLERKVVVYLDGGFGDDADRTGRLLSMSRSTAQVIWVKPEP